jgi:hypothetical protein
MKGLIIFLALCSTAQADGVDRPLVTPYRTMVYLPWLKVPWAHTALDVRLLSGKTYQVSNPQGFGCHHSYNCKDYFLIHGTIDGGKLLIESASHAGRMGD